MCKLNDALLGFATADAFGVPVEFLPRDILSKNPVSQMEEYGSHKVPRGTWSDDTSLTIAAMDSIADCGEINYDDIMKRFVSWVKEAKYTATDVLFDIGNSTSKAIRNYIIGYPPLECGAKSSYENGNGSLMRMLPFVFYAYYNNLPIDERHKLIDDASSITHAHSISKLGCNIYSDYICFLLDGQSKEEAFGNLKTIDYSKIYDQETLGYYSRIFNSGFEDIPVNNIKSSGFVVDSLEASLWCTLNYNNYRDAVVTSVNLGDDTDTVGAITGSINGLLYGADSIPKEWLECLRKKDYLEKICTKFDTNIKKNISVKC